jgi:hypothetical protein
MRGRRKDMARDEKWFDFKHVGKEAHFLMPQIQPPQCFSEHLFLI